jgi:anthranilate synthase/aminodeoxychorismate synthase-like glutamine amidotransferase
MGASLYERELAQTSGVLIRHRVRPHRLIVEGGAVRAVELMRTADAGGKLVDTGETVVVPCDQLFKAIGQVFGVTIVRAKRLMHGKVDRIEHSGQGLFAGLPSPIEATRYHSLVIDPPTLPREFHVDAWSTAPDGSREIMAVRHATLPIYGVQFHPESFLTPAGYDLLRAFLAVGSGAIPAALSSAAATV